MGIKHCISVPCLACLHRCGCVVGSWLSAVDEGCSATKNNKYYESHAESSTCRTKVKGRTLYGRYNNNYTVTESVYLLYYAYVVVPLSSVDNHKQ